MFSAFRRIFEWNQSEHTCNVPAHTDAYVGNTASDGHKSKTTSSSAMLVLTVSSHTFSCTPTKNKQQNTQAHNTKNFISRRRGRRHLHNIIIAAAAPLTLHTYQSTPFHALTRSRRHTHAHTRALLSESNTLSARFEFRPPYASLRSACTMAIQLLAQSVTVNIAEKNRAARTDAVAREHYLHAPRRTGRADYSRLASKLRFHIATGRDFRIVV